MQLAYYSLPKKLKKLKKGHLFILCRLTKAPRIVVLLSWYFNRKYTSLMLRAPFPQSSDAGGELREGAGRVESRLYRLRVPHHRGVHRCAQILTRRRQRKGGATAR